MKNSIQIILFLFLSKCFVQQIERSPIAFPDCNFTAVAHRGYSEFYPENTLVAIEEAFKRGIKYCEIDVALSSDGVFVLHHDPYSISRTTNGQGTIAENTYAQLSKLDAGDWKENFFKGTPLPSLVEALKIAQKYDAYLYLDIKAFNPQGLMNALKDAGVDPKRMMPATTSLEAARAFRKYCPDSPWVWFGANPLSPQDPNWFKERIDLGCKVFELTEDKVLSQNQWTTDFIKNAHAQGGKVWAYTINNEKRIKAFADMGIDGVETDRPYVAQLHVCGHYPVSDYPKKETTGNWNFKKRSLASIGIGSRLKNFSSMDSISQTIIFASTEQFGIGPVGNRDTIVAKIPAYDPDHGLFAYDNFMMEDSGALDYTYSIIMDLYVPSSNKGKYISLFQTNPDNLNDGDFFINPQGQLGTMDSYHGKLTFDVWQRLIMVHDGNVIRKYIDGNLIGETEISGDRWTVFNNMPYHGKHGLLLFADDNGETGELYLNALQLRNYPMETDEIKRLGCAQASGIPIGNKRLYSAGTNGPEFMDWEQNTLYIHSPSITHDKAIPYALKISYGARASIPITGFFDPHDNKTLAFDIIAQDGSVEKWKIVWME